MRAQTLTCGGSLKDGRHDEEGDQWSAESLRVAAVCFLQELTRTSDSRRQLFVKLADMAIKKANVAIGFMVAGVLAVILGLVLTFVGPIIIDDQVVKVSRLFSMIPPSPPPLLGVVTLPVKFVEVISQTLFNTDVCR